MMKLFFQIIAVVALFFGTWFVLSRVDWLKIFKVEQASKKTEEKLGNLFWEVFSQSEKEIHNEKITLPVDSILTSICNANGIDRKEIKLHVIKSDEINAFAFPNKHLVVFTNLVADCQNEAELAGVMAHELAHIQKHHVMKKLIKEVGLSALISIASGGSSEIIRQLAKTISSTAYDRSLESEADLKAIDYLIEAHINPIPFADFLSRLGNDEGDKPNALTWISTHPDSKARAEKIIEYAAGKKQEHEPVLTKETWDKLKDEVKE